MRLLAAFASGAVNKEGSQERLNCSGEPEAVTQGLTTPLGNQPPAPRINFNPGKVDLSPPSLLGLPSYHPSMP